MECIDDEDDRISERTTHIAFADETQHNTGRYRGVGLITLATHDVEQVTSELRHLLHESSISEFKWQKLRSARERFAALRLVDFIISKANERILRVDVLTWDIEDTRHKIQGRSDVRNLRRMYYFLFKHVLCTRWPRTSIWRLCVDEHSAAPWSHLNYLTEIWDWNTGATIAELNIASIEEGHSDQEPLIQVADLFAGLAVYSRQAYDVYEQWLRTGEGGDPAEQTNDQMRTRPLSRSDHERCRVLAYVDSQCKQYKLGVSLSRKRGLRTFNPAKPINFWWYEPQTEDDKAPRW